MNRVFRFRMYPTARQAVALTDMLRDHCTLYNAALQERRDGYTAGCRTIRYGTQSAQLRDIRGFDTDHARWSFSSQQQTLRRLDKAFAAFFARAKRGDTPGYPRFRSVNRFDTVTFIHGDGGTYLPDLARVRMQGIGHVKVKQHRDVRGRIKQFSVTRNGRHWYVNVICVDVPHQVRPVTGEVVGLDRGITHLLADSNGDFVPNPRHARTAHARLAAAQQALSRKRRGSNRRSKAAARVGAQHRKVANTRADHHHKLSRALVDRFDVIVLEDLRIRNMSRSAKGAVDNPGTNVAAKSGLNRSILDAGWYSLEQMIRYKAECAGVDVVSVPAANTSRTCHECGHVSADNRYGERFRCVSCGHAAHADTNAARNILRLGLSRREATAS